MTDLQNIRMRFNNRFYSDPLIRSLYRKVADGGASYAEVQTFAQRASAICSDVLTGYIPEGMAESEVMAWAEELVTPSLTQMHGLIDEAGLFRSGAAGVADSEGNILHVSLTCQESAAMNLCPCF